MNPRPRLAPLHRAALILAATALVGCAQHDANEDEIAAAEAEVGAAAAAPVSSIQLTASDGTGLRLVRLDVRGAVQAPLAFTELHLTFENPENRILEGRFSIELPDDSALSRFAMKVGEQWQEGEVVERMKARTTYEAYLHNNVDPALLEKEAGNRFSAKVFPIPANGRKEIIISYSQDLEASQAPYRLPIRGLPTLDAFNAVFFVDEPGPKASQAKRRTVEVHETDFSPTDDLSIVTTATPATFGVRKGNAAVARIQAQGNTDAVAIEHVTLAFDTSASRALGYGEKVRRLGELVEAVAEHNGDTVLRVVAFDQDAATVFEGRAAEFGTPQLNALLARRALGASNLAQLFATLERNVPSERLILVTDGIGTAGPREVTDLRTALGKLQAKGLDRLDAIVDADRGDKAVLDALVTSGLPHDGTVSRGDLSGTALVSRLTHEVLPALDITVRGADDWWPKRAEGLQPGDSLLVYANLPESAGMRVVLEGDETAEVDVPLMTVPGPLIGRALASAQIDALTIAHSSTTDEARKAELRQQVIELSTDSRVISEFTAMLVLESANDYRRFSIDQTAEFNILTVGQEGVRLTPHARDLDIPRPQPKPQPSGLFAMRGPGGDGDDKNDDQGGSGMRHKGEEGKMGRPSTSAGILGHLSQESGHFLASPHGAAFSVGNDDEDVWGGLTGTEVGEAFGVGGLGLAGAGRGGAVTGDRSIGLGLDGDGFSRTRPVPRVRQNKVKVKGVVPRPLAPVSTNPPEKLADVDAAVASPYIGEMQAVMNLVDGGQLDAARSLALRWRDRAPTDIMAVVATGEVAEAQGQYARARRAYGSLIDLFPSDAPLRRYAGARLQALGTGGLPLAIDTLETAVELRPDHPSSHRGLAYARLANGDHRGAFEAIAVALKRSYPDRYRGVATILRDDASILAAAWLAASPSDRDEVIALTLAAGVEVAHRPSTHMVLSWETDTNDVDLHVYDAKGYHTYYSDRGMNSGGVLYADVTDGYGPESFTISGTPTAYPYRIDVKYFRKGPSGHGLGALQVIQHDGKGHLELRTVPYALQKDGGTARVLELEGPLTSAVR